MEGIHVFIWLLFALPFCHGRSAMAIDLGTDFTKVAVLRQGSPMEIALDGLSRRKIPTIVVLQEGNRQFGNGALSIVTRYPTLTFAELPSIIGKTLDHPAVIAYQRRYPYHNLTFSSESAQLAFLVNGKEYTVETLLAMLLQYIRRTAEAFTSLTTHSAVITVPSYFTQAERRALIRSANLANIKVIQLLNDNAAVALNYITSRPKLAQEKPVYLFFDVGATAATATIVSYQMAHIKGESAGEHPHAFILGAASDTSLGTNVFVDRLQAFLMDQFKKKEKIDADIRKNARTVASFRQEAIRVFKVLSANMEILSVVEEIYNRIDLRMTVTRKMLESLCADLVTRVSSLVEAALKAAVISPGAIISTLSDLQEIIVFGGGSRIPFIQKALLSSTGKQTLSKSTNADEAAAMGAIYQAASNTSGFLVKKFVARDSNRYPLAVTFPRISDGNTTKSNEVELVTRVLFPANNPFPQKRTINFPQLQKDLSFQVHYSEALENPSNYLNGVEQIMNVSISGVKDEIERFEQSGHSPQAVKVHLQLDASGILHLSEVNLVMTQEIPETKVMDAASPLKKLTDGISNLFGSGENKPSDDKVAPQLTEPPQAPNQTTDGDNETGVLNSNLSSTVPANASTPAPHKKTMIHPLPFDVQILDPVNPPKESIGEHLNILQKYDDADNKRNLLNEAKNALENAILTTLSDIETAFDDHVTQAELNNLSAIAHEVSQWFDEEGHSAPQSAIEEQMTNLLDAVNPYKRRAQAYAELPAALTELEEFLSSTAQNVSILMQLNSAANPVTAPDYVQALNLTLEQEERRFGFPIYSFEEVRTMQTLISDTYEWLKETRGLMENCDRRMDPPVHLVAVSEHMEALNLKLKYLGHKGEIWFITYKRLFDIKMAILIETARKAAFAANATTNTTASNDTIIVPPSTQEEPSTAEEPVVVVEPEKPSTAEEPVVVVEPETTPRSDL